MDLDFGLKPLKPCKVLSSRWNLREGLGPALGLTVLHIPYPLEGLHYGPTFRLKSLKPFMLFSLSLVPSRRALARALTLLYLAHSRDLSWRGAKRAEDAQRTPTQRHISPSTLVHEEYWDLREGLWPALRAPPLLPAPVSGLRVWCLGFGVWA